MINKYFDKYIELCLQLDDYTKEGVKKHNKAMKQLAKLFNEIKENRWLAEELYDRLLSYQDERVRAIASAHCLGMNVHIDKAKKCLENISKTSNEPLSRFSAEMTLRTWKEQGFLRF